MAHISKDMFNFVGSCTISFIRR